jgi:DNA-binding transcriptional LysR family regulator
MELLDLKIFCDLVELKSFTETANKNCLTQSAISQRINRLNEYYGNKIFLNKKRLTLSWHGKYLYEKFKDILNIYSSTEEIIEQESSKEVISIGLCENARAKYFNQQLLTMLLNHPFLTEVYFGLSQSIYEKVLFGVLDYGIVGSRPTKPTEIVFDKLYAENIVLATSSANPAHDVDIRKIPIILDHRDSGLYLFLKDKLLTLGVDIENLNIQGYVGTSIDKSIIISQGKFYSFLPEWYLKERSEFRRVPLGFELRRDFYEIYQKKRSHKVEYLIKFIRSVNGLPK